MHGLRHVEMGGHDPIQKEQDDEIEQDRGNHLIGAEPRIQRSRHRAADRPTHSRRYNTSDDREWRRYANREHQAHDAGGEAAERQLGFRANVEQSGAERERHREPGEGQRGRLVQHLSKAVRVAPGAFEQQTIDLGRRLADAEDDHVSDDERHEGAHEHGEQRFHAAPAPAIYRPITSALASARSTTATNRPRSMTAMRSARASNSLKSDDTSTTDRPSDRASRK